MPGCAGSTIRRRLSSSNGVATSLSPTVAFRITWVVRSLIATACYSRPPRAWPSHWHSTCAPATKSWV